ncbi:uncharacterized protein MONOS_11859 [Monocercomonoides exilis]|uniref:uncharacterized protein n=1 Tax=Monocercomonoides exilis TaxID=2049356 RepID=UPI003559CE7C|nr:hypothetical protein MONOS_11859 [Monocercomonoides exilis]|eukprot:MONOS_11859.1-p1 / transcript=MONOS_11859.1 / gene=MONOS_11859 / organism=Monocercomonoides_exilis_PA203 / gene_product=unspecified product / transcript_product=unspecified product / location=Mono_scaffold00619:13307-15346(+) / protein_length=663 / sequence_SO=supercontig / SO=protein_coding / is_pseudo=false
MDDQITILVTPAQADQFEELISKKLTVLELKRLIESKVGISVENQEVSHNRKVLPDEETFEDAEDYHILTVRKKKPKSKLSKTKSPMKEDLHRSSNSSPLHTTQSNNSSIQTSNNSENDASSKVQSTVLQSTDCRNEIEKKQHTLTSESQNSTVQPAIAVEPQTSQIISSSPVGNLKEQQSPKIDEDLARSCVECDKCKQKMSLLQYGEHLNVCEGELSSNKDQNNITEQNSTTVVIHSGENVAVSEKIVESASDLSVSASDNCNGIDALSTKGGDAGSFYKLQGKDSLSTPVASSKMELEKCQTSSSLQTSPLIIGKTDSCSSCSVPSSDASLLNELHSNEEASETSDKGITQIDKENTKEIEKTKADEEQKKGDEKERNEKEKEKEKEKGVLKENAEKIYSEDDSGHRSSATTPPPSPSSSSSSSPCSEFSPFSSLSSSSSSSSLSKHSSSSYISELPPPPPPPVCQATYPIGFPLPSFMPPPPLPTSSSSSYFDPSFGSFSPSAPFQNPYFPSSLSSSSLPSSLSSSAFSLPTLSASHSQFVAPPFCYSSQPSISSFHFPPLPPPPPFPLSHSHSPLPSLSSLSSSMSSSSFPFSAFSHRKPSHVKRDLAKMKSVYANPLALLKKCGYDDEEKNIRLCTYFRGDVYAILEMYDIFGKKFE